MVQEQSGTSLAKVLVLMAEIHAVEQAVVAEYVRTGDDGLYEAIVQTIEGYVEKYEAKHPSGDKEEEGEADGFPPSLIESLTAAIKAINGDLVNP